MELNKIYCEDCFNTMQRMDDDFIDLTVTSPPYDNLRTYNDNIDESWDESVWKPIIKELYRVIKEGGVVVWVVGDATIDGSETGVSFKQALWAKECGFNLHDTMLWEKENPIPNDPSQNRYIQSFEYMFVFSVGKPKACNYITKPCQLAGKYAGTGTARKQDGSIRKDRKQKRQSEKVKDEKPLKNIWKHSNGTIYPDHPATYPEEIPKDHIKSWSNKGDLIYDPFMGSGTTAKMAHLLKRNWIGSEISQEYVDLANRRLQPYVNQQRLF